MTRQELVKEINLILEKYGHRLDEIEIKALNMAKETLEQEPKYGKWLDDNNSFNSFYANCSECGYQIDTHEERGYHNFCPYCGARME